jgi:hypothetical protein
MADSVLGLIPSMLREWLRGNDLRRNSETAFFYHNALVVFTEWPPRPKPLTLLYSKEFVLTVAKMKDPAQQARQLKKRRRASWQEWVLDEMDGWPHLWVYDKHDNMGAVWQSTTTHYAAVGGSTSQSESLFHDAIDSKGSPLPKDLVKDILSYY